MSATGLPATASTMASVSAKPTPSRSASSVADGGLARARRPDQDRRGRRPVPVPCCLPGPRACPSVIPDHQRLEVAVAVAGGLRDGVAAELLQHRVGEHQRDHRLGHHPGGGHGGHVAALVDRLGRLAGARRRRSPARAARSRSASSRRGPGPARRCSSRPRCRRPGWSAADARRRSPSISSCACEPRRAAVAKPSPISTPLIAWMLISAPASRPSSRRSQCTWLPRPGGSP